MLGRGQGCCISNALVQETTHEMFSFPSILRVFDKAPRLIEPLAPPTFLQIEHWQSANGTGVLESTLKRTAPQWQLPFRFTGMVVI